MGDKRTYAAGRFGVIVDGSVFLGFLKKSDGGDIEGEVSQHQLGPNNIIKKNITTIKYNPFTWEVGMGMSQAFYDWVSQSFDSTDANMVKDGAVHACNFDGVSMSIREFYGAQITEVTFPNFDAANKENAYMTVKVTPELIKYMPGSGESISGEIGPASKAWMPSNFRFECAAVGADACARISKVKVGTIKLGTTRDEVGTVRNPTIHPTKLEFPNLEITFSMADFDKWADWHRTFVIEGACEETDETTAQLEFLAPNLETVLGTLNFDHVGIVKLTVESGEANKEQPARANATLYYESLKMIWNVADT